MNKKEQIIEALINKDHIDEIIKELDIMEIKEGLNDRPILDTFYDIWKNNKGKIGSKNEINSWTAYCIGLTSKKPEPNIEFLNKRRAFARKGFPDIDSDFDYERRDEIYKYIIDTHGRDHVGNIGTYSGLKMKSFIRRAVKAIDPERTFFKGFDDWKTETNALGDEILKALPEQYGAFLKVKDEDGQEHVIKTVEDAYKWCKNFRYYINKYPDILTHSRNIEGLLSTFSVHAAGIVISNEPLSHIAPLRQSKIISDDEDSGPKYAFATQFEYNDLEFLGLIKFDILALSTLSVINHCIKLIKDNYGIDVNVYDLPLDDKKTYDLYKSGKLVGVFQCEEYGMQRTMINMGVDSFDDIMAGIALYRPGPMESIPTYCERKHGNSAIDYFHASLRKYIEPITKKTYGLLCIHEDTLISMGDGSLKLIKDVKSGDKVVSVNKENYTEIKECEGCAPTAYGDGFKLELTNGYSIVLTGNHKIMTFDGMKQVSEIDLNKDLIACPSNMRFEYDNIDFFGSWLGDPRDVSYLLGLLLTDGNINVGVDLCCGSLANANKMETWISEKLSKLKVHKYFHTRSWYLSLSCDELVDWKTTGVGNQKTKWHSMLEDLDIKKNYYDKRIPKQILSSSDPIIRQSFLAGMIDGDGCIYVNKNSKKVCCNYASVSYNLLQDLRQLLASLSFPCSISKNKIFIHDTESLFYMINHFLVIKKFPESGYSKGLITCQIPLSVVKEDIAQSGLSERSYCSKYGISRTNFRNKNSVSLNIINKIEKLRNLYNKDIRFYKIKSIEKVENQQFYDMSVRDNHNLIGNGIVISNCYQEQVMQICNSVAGFSIPEGYVVIKAIGKKKPELLTKYRAKFVSGAQTNNIDPKIAQDYWDKVITPFADYGFNKCLDGSTTISNKLDNKIHTISELEKDFRENDKPLIILDSWVDGEIVEDEVIDVFMTGEKEVYEFELSNGFIIRCTMDHKFLCSDNEFRTMKNIMEGDFDILSYNKECMNISESVHCENAE